MVAEVLVGALLGPVHIARVPLVFGGGDGVDAPVDEDAELGVLVPLRLLVFGQGGPVGAVGAVADLALGLGQQAIALPVVLRNGLLPLAVDVGSGFNPLGGSQRVRLCVRQNRRDREEDQRQATKQFCHNGAS